jgi:hypothetical protein
MIVLYHFKKDGSDKIWGWTKTTDGALSFWGRTRGSLSFKHYERVWDAEDQADKKRRKGYELVSNYNQEVGPEVLDLLPEDWKGQFMIAKLGQTKF